MPDSSVTIAGQPVVFDYGAQVREFLADRMPSQENLFSRWQPAPKMHAAIVDNYEQLTAPYPPLPPIELGELQWPTGASRYARALYLVDNASLKAISLAAWGLGSDITTIAEDWGTNITAVPVVIDGEETFETYMLPLPPHRVPGDGAELWLLPLVDARFLRMQIAYDPSSTPGNWAALFTDLATTLGITLSVGAVHADWGIPDGLTIKPGVSAASLLDCASLSVGLRPVVDPLSSVVRLITPTDSDTRRTSTLAKTTIIAGGRRGVGVAPSSVDVWCRKSTEFSLICEEQDKRNASLSGGDPTFAHLAHSAWVVDERTVGSVTTVANSTATNNYVAKVAEAMHDWLDSGGQYAFAGAIAYAPSGYDDYLTIRTAETTPGDYTFTSRVFELPNVFLPSMLLNQTPTLRIAAVIEEFTADDQTTNPGEAYFPGSSTLRVDIAGLTTDDSEQSVTAFYRCGVGWTKLEGGTGGNTELVVFTLTADLAATQGATATANAKAVNVLTGGTTAITVTNPGRFRAFTGAEGVAIKLAEELYWILVVDQPALRVRAVLDAHPDNSGGTIRFGADPRETDAQIKLSPSPVLLTPFPFSFLHESVDPAEATGAIANPLDLLGEDGDTVILEWDADADAYFVSAVYPQRQTELYVTLAADLPTGSLAPSVSCNIAAPSSPGAITTPITVVDRFNVLLNGRSGNRAFVRWQPRLTVGGSGEYQFVAGEHRATRARAVVKTPGFTGAATTFTATVTHGYDGALSGDVTVSNRYNWDAGPINAILEIRWDNIANEWYALQMTCPT